MAKWAKSAVPASTRRSDRGRCGGATREGSPGGALACMRWERWVAGRVQDVLVAERLDSGGSPQKLRHGKLMRRSQS
ncbi:hypothetical protein PsYK624_117120 [Phanerochaete sordida]|uniref:Uncharacterized protein n=1 Tax=Phanerochaete sordida TaxID=48140 RepID=A0A9P3GH58_9APHY|nr:hypothetical protein PsYK624_117120 [Phanerochaete sordida]